ncbi:hypothetical protein BCON_0728g00010 [Botryotinia convoluta]|uniref:Uncharacterized protein n=1 Tax=Botryotinia convoluta TaxID=54673 RepID=A0A4Z1H4J7_9HELO|nr:hypothetical protein BCON_0728g00010 [Botryotinia convoluta]
MAIDHCSKLFRPPIKMLSELDIIYRILNSAPQGRLPRLSIRQVILLREHEEKKARMKANALAFKAPAAYGSPFVNCKF